MHVVQRLISALYPTPKGVDFTAHVIIIKSFDIIAKTQLDSKELLIYDHEPKLLTIFIWRRLSLHCSMQ